MASNLVETDGLELLSRLVAEKCRNESTIKKKLCIFLGAGADISSGGITFFELKKRIVEQFSGRHIFDVTPEDVLQADYERIVGQLSPDDRAVVLETIFRELRDESPSDSYRLLVLLAEAGGLDAVITTNFDLMLENAQAQLGRNVFQVFAPGLARPYMVSYDRYDLPQRPYLKLHGDLSSRAAMLLTSAELENSSYDPSMIELLLGILRTHDIIFAGYGGFDRELANILSGAINEGSNRVYWCNPITPSAASPLYKSIGARATYIATEFDKLLEHIARPVLEKPQATPVRPSYLKCLFEWRLEYSNRYYLRSYAEKRGKSATDLFARRMNLEDKLTSFLKSRMSLAIVAGPSGHGKTVLGVRLEKLWKKNSSTYLLLIPAVRLASPDIEEYLYKELGGPGSPASYNLFQMERWLSSQGTRLVLFIDGINEFNTDSAQCVALVRNILRICYFLPEEGSAIKIVATIRQETWHSMLDRIDIAQLGQALWTDSATPGQVAAIACGKLTDAELIDALERAGVHGSAGIDLSMLTPAAVDHLKDPYLMSIVAAAAKDGLPPVISADVYHRAFEFRFRRCGSSLGASTLKDIVSAVAAECLSRGEDHFRAIAVSPPEIREEAIRVLKDLGLILDAEKGLLRFSHDRTYEYFLACAIATGAKPSLETIHNLRNFVIKFNGNGKALSAARLYFQLYPEETFKIIKEALNEPNVIASGSRHSAGLTFEFARAVLIEMSEFGVPIALQYIADALDASKNGEIGEWNSRTAVHAAAVLPAKKALPLLSKVADTSGGVAGIEAMVFAAGKLAKEFFRNASASVNFLTDEPYSTYFECLIPGRWKKLGRIIGFSAHVGPDNTCPAEYSVFQKALGEVLDNFLAEGGVAESDISDIAEFIVENSDRLLFNSTKEEIERFFVNEKRKHLSSIVRRISSGGLLEMHDINFFQRFNHTLASGVEYLVSHAIIVLASMNSMDSTLELIEEYVREFSNSTCAIEIDFYQAVLVYLHVIHGVAYNEARFASWEEKILSSWSDVLMYRPGLQRGERRGFYDKFDQIFEDGFGVIYPYGILMPSARRHGVRYKQYCDDQENLSESPLPLYSKYLAQFLDEGRVEEALQVLQAIASVIVVWPTEGLWALRRAIGNPNPLLRRGVTRVLAEAYGRHPEETLRFINTSGAAINDADLLEIKIGQDARIGRRQVKEEEWARICHFLFARSERPLEILSSCLLALLEAESLREAVFNVLQAAGVSVGTIRK
jgi:hypothetical protein